jgi:hypothetical protein
MADIDSIISGVSGNTRYDFSTFGDPVKSYFDAKDQRAKNDLRDAFKGGVPTLPDGSIDYSTMQRTLYQKGALDQGNALSGISARAGELEALRGADGMPHQASAQPTVGPSTSRNSVTPDPGKRMDVAQAPGNAPAPQGEPGQQPTIMNVVAAQGFPNTELQKISESIARQLGVDPTAPLNLQDPQVRNVLAPAIAQFKRMNLGQVQAPGSPQPQAPAMAQAQPQGAPMAQASQAAPQGFLPPPNVVAAQNDPILKRLTLLSASQDKQIAAAAKVRLEAYLKNQELTPDQKNARASGLSVPDYQSQGDERAAQLAILKDTVLPELKVSKEGASAARSEIQALHRAREQMDGPGGIFTSTGAPIVLKLAKVAEYFGVPNADKITNTETFKVAIGGRVLASLKSLGVNPSNKDLIFAEKMAGGDIELNESSIRRILDIGEQAARDKIERHNTTAGQFIESNEALKPYAKAMRIDIPGQYQRPKGGKGQSATAGFEDAKKAPDGNFYVPDPARPGKYLRVVQ